MLRKPLDVHLGDLGWRRMVRMVMVKMVMKRMIMRMRMVEMVRGDQISF